MESKEQDVLELFFEEPTKEWHFEGIVKETKIARSKADRWLKKFVKTNLIRRIKKRGKMPYYTSNYASSEYKNKKKIFALNKLYESGLLNHLCSLKKAKDVIIFGSFSRSDWYKNSDVDVFIYGDHEGLKISPYKSKLHRNIQVFIYKNKRELKKLEQGFIKNVIKGNIIKGNLDFLEVKINA